LWGGKILKAIETHVVSERIYASIIPQVSRKHTSPIGLNKSGMSGLHNIGLPMEFLCATASSISQRAPINVNTLASDKFCGIRT
jgi:hypothetical protein